MTHLDEIPVILTKKGFRIAASFNQAEPYALAAPSRMPCIERQAGQNRACRCGRSTLAFWYPLFPV